MNVNKEKEKERILFENKLVIDLLEDENKPKIYIEKDYRNYTLEEDGLIFVKVQNYCTGCYPIFMNNQLAHMDFGGCLYREDYTLEDLKWDKSHFKS